MAALKFYKIEKKTPPKNKDLVLIVVPVCGGYPRTGEFNRKYTVGQFTDTMTFGEYFDFVPPKGTCHDYIVREWAELPSLVKGIEE